MNEIIQTIGVIVVLFCLLSIIGFVIWMHTPFFDRWVNKQKIKELRSEGKDK